MSMGYKLYGTSGTCAWLNKHMVPCNEVRNISGEAPNLSLIHIFISTASALHDIGKIVIPEEILNKPGRLTAEEFAVIKNLSLIHI